MAGATRTTRKVGGARRRQGVRGRQPTAGRARLAARVLFEERLQDGSTLFAGPTDLARALRRYDRESGVRLGVSFLSQILAGSRSCPPELEVQILAAVTERMTGTSDAIRSRWADRVRAALQADRGITRLRVPMAADALYEELRYFAEFAKEHFIITTRPAERVPSTYAEPLRSALVRRLELGQPRRSPPRDLGVHYTFCFPSMPAATSWWMALVEETREAADETPMEEGGSTTRRLIELDEADVLRVFVVQSIACGCPVVVFDANSTSPTGFNLYYFDDSGVSVAQMDPQSIIDWKTYVLGPFESTPGLRERVHVARVLGGTLST